MELFYLAIKVAIGSAIGTSIGLWLVLRKWDDSIFKNQSKNLDGLEILTFF